MISYHLAALALKAFSCSEPSRRLYRGVGNWLGGRNRATGAMPSVYFERANRNVATCLKYAPLHADDLVLEVGTGWVHWEALTLRLFFDFQAVLYDVWDNRQLSALKSFVGQLGERFGEKGFLDGCDFDRARSLIREIQRVHSFDDLYRMLGFRYVVDRGGLMESLPRNTFRVVISAGVMEHIPSATASQFVSNLAALSVKGGIGIHSINPADHLYYYDRSASPKQYMSYSEAQWKFWCENGVQYINRIQRSDWLRMFTEAGFSILEEGGSYANLADLRIHPVYQRLSRKDVDCTYLGLVVCSG
jgi:hypothetical protein